ncbi:MAG: translation elongation factor 4 [Candidatus Omnitrophica bacterium]|nr:translation elongation factor 4 [Candidatus Omnitrophota bacterium]
MNISLIRNFCIIAHIDHGKSTLADRFLLHTGAINEREFHNQMLDDMELEQERGITIKASAVRINYKSKDGNTYCLNLIDTPGHVDFSFEVAKSLSACEGAILVIDAVQGVEAQTVANLYLALEHHLKIIPVINKIDLSNAEPVKVEEQIRKILNLKEEPITFASAKEGIGVEEILERIVREISPPTGDKNSPLQALIFDSSFDNYKGVVVYVRLVNGFLKKGMKVMLMGTGKIYEVQEVGVFQPRPVSVEELSAGEVGYFTANIRQPKEINAGETVTYVDFPAKEPLPGYRSMHPMVYCGIYPVNPKDFPLLREAVEKLKLNDASFIFEPESSSSLGPGFRCGFLGLLHMEIVQERLEREYGLNLILTTPSVKYKIKTRKAEIMEVDNPSLFPSSVNIAEIYEPYVKAHLIIPQDFLGSIMEFALSRRGIYKSTEYLGDGRCRLVYEIPLSEIIVDFYDKIKSMTRGYGSLDYEFTDYRATELVKLDVLVNGKPCDALSSLVHKDKAQLKARNLVTLLRQLIPRQLFEVVIQAAIGSHVVAKERIPPLRKDVTAKCYGGDITRKRKLWEKQKEGKKRLKQFGNIEIPQEAFMAVLKLT